MRLLTVFILFLTMGAVSAQTSVHFDRPFHVAGEVAWFSVYPPSPAPPKVRATVYSPNGDAIDYFFLSAEDGGRYQGYYRWPFEAQTGYFRVSFTGLSSSGQTLDIGTVRHPVYADKRVEPSEAEGNTAASDTPPAAGLALGMTGNKLTLSGTNGDAYSLSIVNEDVITSNAEAFFLTSGGSNIPAADTWVDTLFYPAEVMTAAGTPLTTNLLPVFDPNRYEFGFAKSDEAGSVTLQTPPFEGEKMLQLRDLNGADLKPSTVEFKLSPIAEKPVVTQAVATYIDLSRRRRKIYQLFATVETEIDAAASRETPREVRPNRDFNVQDYKAFPDMFTFFKEVAGELKVRLKKGNYTARLYNAPNQRYFGENPLYIIDGRLTRDDNYVMNLSPSEIRYLAFYYVGSELRRNFPALGNNGVVRIETIRGLSKFPAADAEDSFSVKGLQPAADFPVRDAAESDVPAISPVLLWETGAGDATFDLPATDDIGKYRVFVVTRSAEGKVRAANHSFEVSVK
ncbi:hypothetical protein FUA23_04090 [Neolewinella aurantiaca]|uniref:Uncharacterized protein n=1 Tax=Neolewinella aurantiaca TaxID=2602767 RepID=A0A5C7FX21_9BACT|nr:hypothetical protein [Neolewinella aurantiaca]TXF90990.1 hypothetical protein FUA23_04090 [Neolewinella aurantiaca]